MDKTYFHGSYRNCPIFGVITANPHTFKDSDTAQIIADYLSARKGMENYCFEVVYKFSKIVVERTVYSGKES